MTIVPQRRRRRGLFGAAYDAFMYGGARPTFVPIVSPDGGLPLSPQDARDASRALRRAVFQEPRPEIPRSTNPTARWAEGQVGGDGYGRFDRSDEALGRTGKYARGIGSPKCNIFVWDALTAGGAQPARLDGGRIPVAKEWGNPKVQIGGYAVVTGPPRPGDVISNGHHVGIYSPLANGKPGTVSAASPAALGGSGGVDGGVVHNNWGFRGDEGPITVRRYVGPRSGRP